jgi:large subunit ribosomal protein L23
LLSPRITEKAAYMGEKGCYVFNIAKNAGKQDVARAVRAIYKVTPRKVTVAVVRGKKVVTRGTNRPGHSASGKKAYVYLKSGDTIELA